MALPGTNNVRNTSRWFTCHRSNPRAKLNLFCFPYAGGSATIFCNWAASLPPEVEVFPVQLPGRGNRLTEPPVTDLSALISITVEALRPYLNKPFAFFGHSFGASLSFELSRRLRLEGSAEPRHLFISGRRAPHISESLPTNYNLPENEFIEELRRLNGTPAELLEHPELMRLMIPVLRADFQICETYNYSPGPPLNCPITVFGGLQDVDILREYLEAWREQTASDFKLVMLPGDHFFVHTSESLLMRMLSRGLHRIIKDL